MDCLVRSKKPLGRLLLAPTTLTQENLFFKSSSGFHDLSYKLEAKAPGILENRNVASQLCDFSPTSAKFSGAAFAIKSLYQTIGRRDTMTKHLFQGIVCGGIFAAVITWIAASDAATAGGFALLASVVFGLAAGLCAGALIAANFAMLDLEEKEHKETVEHPARHAHAAA
jgi:hypothetical protein